MFVGFTFKVAKVDDFLNIQHQVEAINSQNQCELAFVTTDDEIKKLKSGETKELNVKLILSDNLAVQRFCKVLKNERDAEIAQIRRENLQNIKLALAAEQEQNDSTVEQPNEPYFEIIWPDYIPEITKQTIYVLLGNIMAKSPHGFRFENDPIVLDLAFLIETKSESAYEQLRRFISLFPSRMTLFNYFSDPINNMKDFLLHPECLDKMLSYMNYHIPDGGRFAIALDAVELKSLVISKDKNFQSLDIKDLFVFLALPLNFEAPNFVASILPSKNGFASSILGKIQAVIDKLSDFIEISYIFTDGDAGYKEKQQKFVKQLKKAKNIDELIEIAQNYIEHHQVWSVDIVHLSKRDRKFFIRKDVELYAIPFQIDSHIQPERLKEVVKLGDALQDQSGLGAMKDKYAIAIFSMFCLEKLLQAGYYNEALFIAPFSLWYESIRNEVIDFDTRMFMLKTAVHLVMSILCKHDEMGIKNNFQTEERGEINVKFKFIANEMMLEQMLSALSVFIVEFNRNQNLNFSHLTTMTEEHLFGLLRVMSHFKYDLDTAMTTLAQTNEVLRINFKYEMEWRTASRDYQTGITFNPDKCTVNIPIDISPFEAANSLFHAANWDIPDADGIEVFKKFVSEVVKVHSPIHISAHICSPLSGVNITSRYKVDIKGDDSEESMPIVNQAPQIFVHESNLMMDKPELHCVQGRKRTKLSKKKINSAKFKDQKSQEVWKFIARCEDGITKENIVYKIHLLHPDVSEEDINNEIGEIIQSLIDNSSIEYNPITGLYYPGELAISVNQ